MFHRGAELEYNKLQGSGFIEVQCWVYNELQGSEIIDVRSLGYKEVHGWGYNEAKSWGTMSSKVQVSLRYRVGA